MTLRISAPSSEEGGRRSVGGPAAAPDYYLARLVKLIPGEAVVAYPFLHSRAEEVVRAVEAEAESARQAAAAADPTAVVEPAVTGLSEVALSGHWLLIAVAWLILLVVVLLRWQATRVENGPAQWGAVFIAAVSFFLWVPVMGGSFGVLDTVQTYTGTVWPVAVQKFIPELLLILWTILVPAFYRPQG